MGGFEEKVALVIPIIEEEARLNACFDADAWDNMAKNTRDRYIFSYLLEKYTADTEHLDKKIKRLQAENEEMESTLRVIAGFMPNTNHFMSPLTGVEKWWYNKIEEIQKIAKEALEQSTIKGE